MLVAVVLERKKHTAGKDLFHQALTANKEFGITMTTVKAAAVSAAALRPPETELTAREVPTETGLL